MVAGGWRGGLLPHPGLSSLATLMCPPLTQPVPCGPVCVCLSLSRMWTVSPSRVGTSWRGPSVPPARWGLGRRSLSHSAARGVAWLQAMVTAKSREVDYFCCFPRTTPWLLPRMLWVRIFSSFTTIPDRRESRSGLILPKGSRELPFRRNLEEPSVPARVTVSLIFSEACSHPSGLFLAQMQREVARVLMGMGAPTQEPSSFTGLGPSASFQAARS